MGRVRISYTKSSIGYKADQAHTLRSLGLRKLGQSVEKPDTPDVRGMIHKISHLVQVSEIKD